MLYSADQPMEVSDSKYTHSHFSKNVGKVKCYSRKIQPALYKKFQWITVCTSKYKIFCACFRSANLQGLLTFSKCQKMTFIDQGFGSWNKAIQRFNKHEKSEMH